MTPARRSPLAATVALLITVLVVLMPASAAVALPSTGQLLGKPIAHHLTIPAVLRAEPAIQDLQSDAALAATTLLGLALLGRAGRRTADTPTCRIAPATPGSRDPPGSR